MTDHDDEGPQPAPTERPDWHDNLGPPPSGLPYVPAEQPARPDPPPPAGDDDTDSETGTQAPGSERLGERQPPWRRTESIPPRRRTPDTRVARPAPETTPPSGPARPAGTPADESAAADTGQGQPPMSSRPTSPQQQPWDRQAPAPAAEQAQPYERRHHQAGPGGASGSVLHTTPLWRLLGVILAFGAFGLAGYGLNVVGHVDDAATILSVTIVYTIGFWARRQKPELAERLGPFSKIGVAIVESDEEVRAWVARRTLLAGVLVAALAGVGIAILKAGIEAALGWLASPWLAAALGCAVGALVVAPDLWQGMRDSMRKGNG